MCEMVVQMMNARSKTDFVAVRFGNVLGSNGSAILLFKADRTGRSGDGDLPDIIRYFMTILRQVSVLQAGPMQRAGRSVLTWGP